MVGTLQFAEPSFPVFVTKLVVKTNQGIEGIELAFVQQATGAEEPLSRLGLLVVAEGKARILHV